MSQNALPTDLSSSADQTRSPERHRPLLTAALALIAGIITARYLPIPFAHTLLAAAAFALLAFLLRRRIREALQTALFVALIATAGAATQAWHNALERARAQTSLARLLKPGPTLCRLSGTVDGEAAVSSEAPLIAAGDVKPSRNVTFRLEAAGIESDGCSVAAFGAVRVTVNELPESASDKNADNAKANARVEATSHGDRVTLFGWITPLDPDSEADRYARSAGLVARMSVKSPAAVHVDTEGPSSFFRALYAAKRSFRRSIDGRFSADSAGVLKAMLLGDTARLDPHLRSVFNKSGMMHVLSISGLHVGIVYAALFWLCRVLLLGAWPRRTLVLAVILAYALMTGLQPAMVRASLMIFLFELGLALRYYRDPVNAVAAAALIILLIAPEHLFEAGFQLTFAGVLGIILFHRDIARFIDRHPGPLERFADPALLSSRTRALRLLRKTAANAVSVSAAATLLVLPLQALYFHIVTPVSILATALLIPIVGALTALGFLFLALSWLPPLAWLVAQPLALAASLFTGTVQLAAATPFGHAFVPPPSLAWIILFYAALLLLPARRWLRLRGTYALVAPTLVLSLYLGSRALVAPGPELAATFINVEHGTAVLITCGGRTALYDCGSGTPMSTYDVGAERVPLRLWNLGVRHIDVLFLSHTDADHVNGVASLLDRFHVGRVIANAGFLGRDEEHSDKTGQLLLKEFTRRHIPFAEASAGDSLTLGDARIDILWPPPDPAPWRLSGVNDRSLVLRVSSGPRSILLTADIEQAGIAALLNSQPRLDAEILYLPHHGADEPGLPGLIQRVRPRYTVISDSASFGGFRSPKDRANVYRLLDGIPLYQTFRNGDIHFTATADGWSVRISR